MGKSEAPRRQGGASRKGNFVHIVPLDPAYKQGGACAARSGQRKSIHNDNARDPACLRQAPNKEREMKNAMIYGLCFLNLQSEIVKFPFRSLLIFRRFFLFPLIRHF